MLKNRLAKLEQTIKQLQQADEKLYLCYQDRDKNRMVISDLNFFGTKEDGQTLMEQHPHSLFVIMDIRLKKQEYTDEEWKQLVESMAR